jgi:pilus assembly protein CpaE
MAERTTTARVAPAETGLKILVFGPARDKLENVARVLRAENAACAVATAAGTVDELAAAVARVDPDLLIVQLPDAGPPVLEQIDRLEHLYARMTPILLCDDQSSAFLMAAMRVGVREVLPIEVAPEVLRGTVTRLSQKTAGLPKQHGKVLAFMSCKGGGGGSTFLATNLAYVLGAVERRKVIVIDLNLQWGDAAFFVSDRKPTSTLADVATQIHRMDAEFLASSLIVAHPNVGILAAPDDPVQALEVKSEHIDLLLRLARNNYDFVILDAGRALDAVTIRALDYADVIYPIIQMSLPYLRDCKRLLEAFRALGYPDGKIRLIVNRFVKNGDISAAEMEQAVGARAFRTLPNDYAVVSGAINQGMPVEKAAHGSAIARKLRDFAQELVAEPGARPTGWFQRMIGRA